ncbi:MAG: glutathione S-transferase [Cellvibrionales bacterium TMED49]|nr:glutathione S-transferase [Porticoccaceae bacterium]OUU35023.1 MAG: glutathione S-transferase [Cellvibrionales bacterium TMED49]
MINVPKGFYRLYAAPHSLYAGRARAYLIKRNIPFEEFSVGHPSFVNEVLAKSKLFTIPTLVTPDGDVIRDGGAIVDHLEEMSGNLFSPDGCRQSIVSSLFELVGCEGLRRPAMHFRWNFPRENKAYLHYLFFHTLPETDDRELKTAQVMDRLTKTTVLRGVTEENQKLVESLYFEFIDALDEHFRCFPYLLGARPSRGDFGLISPLYGHLGRDPYPARMMVTRTPRVSRWVERMNRPNQDAPEYFSVRTDFLNDDYIPETLLLTLKIVSEDFIPETRASVEFMNKWLSTHKPKTGEPASSDQASLPGMIEFTVRDTLFQAAVVPYRHLLLQAVQQTYDKHDASERKKIKTLLESCGMSDILDLRLSRRMGRKDNLEVWLD